MDTETLNFLACILLISTLAYEHTELVYGMVESTLSTIPSSYMEPLRFGVFLFLGMVTFQNVIDDWESQRESSFESLMPSGMQNLNQENINQASQGNLSVINQKPPPPTQTMDLRNYSGVDGKERNVSSEGLELKLKQDMSHSVATDSHLLKTRGASPTDEDEASVPGAKVMSLPDGKEPATDQRQFEPVMSPSVDETASQIDKEEGKVKKNNGKAAKELDFKGFSPSIKNRIKQFSGIPIKMANKDYQEPNPASRQLDIEGNLKKKLDLPGSFRNVPISSPDDQPSLKSDQEGADPVSITSDKIGLQENLSKKLDLPGSSQNSSHIETSILNDQSSLKSDQNGPDHVSSNNDKKIGLQGNLIKKLDLPGSSRNVPMSSLDHPNHKSDHNAKEPMNIESDKKIGKQGNLLKTLGLPGSLRPIPISSPVGQVRILVFDDDSVSINEKANSEPEKAIELDKISIDLDLGELTEQEENNPRKAEIDDASDNKNNLEKESKTHDDSITEAKVNSEPEKAPEVNNISTDLNPEELTEHQENDPGKAETGGESDKTDLRMESKTLDKIPGIFEAKVDSESEKADIENKISVDASPDELAEHQEKDSGQAETGEESSNSNKTNLEKESKTLDQDPFITEAKVNSEPEKAPEVNTMSTDLNPEELAEHQENDPGKAEADGERDKTNLRVESETLDKIPVSIEAKVNSESERGHEVNKVSIDLNLVELPEHQENNTEKAEALQVSDKSNEEKKDKSNHHSDDTENTPKGRVGKQNSRKRSNRSTKNKSKKRRSNRSKAK